MEIIHNAPTDALADIHVPKTTSIQGMTDGQIGNLVTSTLPSSIYLSIKSIYL